MYMPKRRMLDERILRLTGSELVMSYHFLDSERQELLREIWVQICGLCEQT